MKKSLYFMIGGVLMAYIVLGTLTYCQSDVYEWYIDDKNEIQSKPITRAGIQPTKYLHTGQIKFDFASSHGKVWQKNESFNLVLKNVYGQFNIDNFKDSDVKNWIKSTGIDTNDIIFTKAFGSSEKQSIECFFAYLSTDSVEYRDVCLLVGGLYCNYQKRSSIRFSNFENINTDDCKEAIKKMCLNYDVKTWFVRSMEVPAGPLLIIARGVRDGYSMDMRNTYKSYRLVDYYKDLNWYNIKYQDQNGKDVSINRPKTGW